ncbi:Kinesin-like protein kif24 [Nowakowskiella sp. JEL0078]|nr:Kinesin-like protein kif24 [Nowakowskiella sp. JEL0078]
MMSSNERTVFGETLKRAALSHYYSSLSAFGITSVDSLLLLTMQDYTAVGVHSMEDRKKLFQLIQTLKNEYGNPASLAAPSSLPVPLPLPSFSTSRIPTVAPPTTFQQPITMLPKPSASVISSTNQQLPPPQTESPRLRRSNSLHNTKVNEIAESQKLEQDSIVAPQQLNPSAATYSLGNNAYLAGNSGINYSVNDGFAELNMDKSTTHKYAKRGSAPTISSPPQNSMANLSLSRPKLNAYGIPIDKVEKTEKSSKTSSSSSLMDRIRVCVRKRPLNKKETRRNEADVANVYGRKNITISEHRVKVDLTKFVEQHSFTFDEVIDSTASNEDVYRRTAQPLVSHIFSGGRGTCFAYGQTGSGKTYTMLDPTNGLYVLAAQDIFLLLGTSTYAHLSAWISFYEIYQGALFDLLGDRKKMYAREDGNGNVIVKGLREVQISDVPGLLKVFEEGNNARSTGITGANADSSRSHAILQICLKNKSAGGKNSNKVLGKFSFIDLAGSERGADRGESDQKTRMEGSEINKSLLALKECIRALDQVSKHTPFRQSKLTQVLKDSFIG